MDPKALCLLGEEMLNAGQSGCLNIGGSLTGSGKLTNPPNTYSITVVSHAGAGTVHGLQHCHWYSRWPNLT